MVPTSNITLPSLSKIGSAITLPNILSVKAWMISPPSIIDVTVIESFVPQSSRTTTQSWDTSTNLRVKYPELAVFRAVSARPFLAPWVEIKYWSTDKPSLKLAVIGVSIIEPSGLDISPRIPESCLICAGDPRAPESAYIYTELKEDCWTSLPSLSVTVSELIFSIIAFATCSLALDQISITLLYLSPLVTNPDSNCFSIALTSFSEESTIDAFASGITKSLTPIDDPDRVEKSKPKYINWSANITVFFKPAFLYEMSISFEIDFLFKVLFILSNPTSIGVTLQARTLPTVVSSINEPFSAFSIRHFIEACNEIVSASKALKTSSGLLNTLPSPLELTFSRVM